MSILIKVLSNKVNLISNDSNSLIRNLLLLSIIFFAQFSTVFGQNKVSPEITPSHLSQPQIFIENKGQWDEEVRYQGYGSEATINFQKDKMRFLATKGFEIPDSGFYFLWELNFVDALNDVQIIPSSKSSHYANYLKGNDPSKYITKVAAYEKIRYKNIYNQIDLNYYTKNGDLKYDFIIKPGGDAKDIRMEYRGIDSLLLEANGQLIVHTIWKDFVEQKPYSYQIINGSTQVINSTFHIINDSTYTIKILEDYNEDYELVIDPIFLGWSTYVGGTSNNEAWAYDVASDAVGNVYFAGIAQDGNFPTTIGSVQPIYGGSIGDGFVSKLDPTGTSLVWSSYIGGKGYETIYGLEVNDEQEVFVTGHTNSSNFPVTTVFSDTSIQSNDDCFVSRLKADGTGFIYSDRIGGSQLDKGRDIAIDKNNNAYITGMAKSTDFPVSTTAYDRTHNGVIDAFVLKVSPNGSQLFFSSFYGGTDFDDGSSIKVSCTGDIFVCGKTKSSDLSTFGTAYDQTYNGSWDIFISKFSSDGQDLMASSYIGGSGDESEGADNSKPFLALSSLDEPLVTSFSNSNNYPITSGSYDMIPPGNQNKAVVSKFNNDLSDLQFSTFLGGSSSDIGFGIDLDHDDNIWIAGATASDDFPITPDAFFSSHERAHDLFVTKLFKDGSQLLFSTYMGGQTIEWQPKIELNKDFEIVVSGISLSSDFPTTPGVYDSLGNIGTNDYLPFVVKIVDSSSLKLPCVFELMEAIPTLSPSSLLINCESDTGVFFSIFNNSSININSFEIAWSVNGAVQSDYEFTAGVTPNASVGGFYLPYQFQPNNNYSIVIEVLTINDAPNFSSIKVDSINYNYDLVYGDDVALCEGEEGLLYVPDSLCFESIIWNNNILSGSVTGFETDTFEVDLITASGCALRDTVIMKFNSAVFAEIENVESSCNSINISCSNTIELAVFGGSPPYSINYLDRNFETVSTLINIVDVCPNGTFVTISDEAGCNIDTLDISLNSSFTEYDYTIAPSCESQCANLLEFEFSKDIDILEVILINSDNDTVYFVDDFSDPIDQLSYELCPDTYRFYLEDQRGCVLSETLTVTKQSGIPKVLPNPFHEAIKFEGLSVGSSVTIYDTSGKIVYQNENTSTTLPISGNKFSAGLYIYHVINECTELVGKIINF